MVKLCFLMFSVHRCSLQSNEHGHRWGHRWGHRCCECLNVDAVKLIEATPGTTRGQSFEELSHLGKRVNHQKNVRFKGGKTGFNGGIHVNHDQWDLGVTKWSKPQFIGVEFYLANLDRPNFRGMTRLNWNQSKAHWMRTWMPMIKFYTW